MKAIVLTLNGCSLAALGPYGNEWIATPNLDRLATEAVVFDRHLSCSPEPNAARRAWLSARHQWPDPPTLQPQNLLVELAKVGVHSVLIRNNRPENDGPPEFYAGWGELFDARPDPAPASPATALLRILPDVLNSLQSRENWLLWIDCDRLLPPWDAPQDLFDIYVEELIQDESEPAPTADANPPAALDDPADFLPDENEPEIEAEYEPEYSEEVDEEPEPEPPPPRESIPPWTDPPRGWFDKEDLSSWELLHRSYAAAITAFDADLGKLFEEFRSSNLHDEALWLFTSDRGFPLGEHGQVGTFRPWLHEELVHVPLIIRPPGQEPSRRVAAITQPADVASTLGELFQVACQPADGNSLLPWLQGKSGPSRDFAVSRLDLDGYREWALRTAHWTLLKPESAPADDHEEAEIRDPQLYQMPDDRWEVNDIWRQQEAVLEELLQQLEAAITASRSSPP